MEVNNKCCNKEMICLNAISYDRTITDEQVFICGECGTVMHIRIMNYDDDELIGLVENHSKELKNTRIFQGMVKS